MNGKKISVLIGTWFMIKSVLNILLGFSIGNVVSLLFAVGFAYVLYLGVPYTNYIISILVAIVVIKNLPYNLLHFQIIYLLEGIIDAFCVYLLVANDTVKEHFAK